MREVILLQEKYRDDPWKLLVCCILLNQTTRKQVDKVEEKLFERFPGCVQMASADHRDIFDIVKSLGFGRTRARRLKLFSSDWLVVTNEGRNLPTSATVRAMHGIGKYACDSYRIFVIGQDNVVPDDKELKAYLGRRRRELDPSGSR
jgi:adenine-specific DNA glycosylase